MEGCGQTFLHGFLVIHVREARNIPDMENWYSKLYDKKDVTDAFVMVMTDMCEMVYNVIDVIHI